MKTLSSVMRSRVSSPSLSISLLICSAIWLVGAFEWYWTSATKHDWTGVPLFWMLIIMVTPAACFSFSTVLVNARKSSRISRLDRCALVTAVFPVTLGSFLSMWAVKVLFWAGFQDASVVLRSFGFSVSIFLVLISGSMVWKTARSLLSNERLEDSQPV
jgi:hypothetical protein